MGFRRACRETATEDHRRLRFSATGPDEPVDLGRIMLSVRVEGDDYFPRPRRGQNRRRFAARALAQLIGCRSSQTGGAADPCRVVGGAIVDHDDILLRQAEGVEVSSSRGTR